MDEIEKLKNEIRLKQSELARLEALEVDIPLVVGKTYMTKMAATEPFTLTRIQRNKKNEVAQLFGVYENHKHLGECGLGADRLKSKTGVFLTT